MTTQNRADGAECTTATESSSSTSSAGDGDRGPAGASAAAPTSTGTTAGAGVTGDHHQQAVESSAAPRGGDGAEGEGGRDDADEAEEDDEDEGEDGPEGGEGEQGGSATAGATRSTAAGGNSHIKVEDRDEGEGEGDEGDGEQEGDGEGDGEGEGEGGRGGSRREHSKAKLYTLENSEWVDQGTGFVSSGVDMDTDGLSILVHRADQSLLLKIQVSTDRIYNVEQEKVMVWCDPKTKKQLSLSFLNPRRCQEIMSEIQQFHDKYERALKVGVRKPSRQIPFVKYTEKKGLGNGDDEDEDDEEDDDDCDVDFPLAQRGQVQPPASVAPLDIPAPSMQNLSELRETIMTASCDPLIKPSLIQKLSDHDFITQLYKIFGECGDLEYEAGLQELCRIFKFVALLGDPRILAVFFSSDNIDKTIAAFECDPDLPEECRARHRDNLATKVFKEPVPFTDARVVSLIHYTSKLLYSRDVVLARWVIDDGTYSLLSGMILSNQQEIVKKISADTEWQSTMIKKLLSSKESSEERQNILLFLQELYNLSKQTVMKEKTFLIGQLFYQDLLGGLTKSLSDGSAPIRLATVDLITSTLLYDSNLIRTLILSQATSGHPFMAELTTRLLTDDDPGLIAAVADIIKSIFDPEVMILTGFPSKDKLVLLLYNNFFLDICSPLGTSPTVHLHDQRQINASNKDAIINSVVELICFCISRHGPLARPYVLNTEVIKQIPSLIGSGQKHLVLAGIRLFRICLGTKDPTYVKYLVEHRLYDPLHQILMQNITKDNLINSAVVDALNFCQKENIKEMVAYITTNYRAEYSSIQYVDTFSKVLLRHKQNIEYEVRGTVPRSQMEKPKSNAEEHQKDNPTNSNEPPSPIQTVCNPKKKVPGPLERKMAKEKRAHKEKNTSHLPTTASASAAFSESVPSDPDDLLAWALREDSQVEPLAGRKRTRKYPYQEDEEPSPDTSESNASATTTSSTPTSTSSCTTSTSASLSTSTNTNKNTTEPDPAQRHSTPPECDRDSGREPRTPPRKHPKTNARPPTPMPMKHLPSASTTTTTTPTTNTQQNTTEHTEPDSTTANTQKQEEQE
ncbi:serine/threonine-protein phosphatase 4 regulatory subunit 3A [Pelomyxa schiedti]|nr:serine/threonine-protein phosphatase 4 regulatory subunit 3A [Pelomyxa schiedti]